MDDTFTFTVTFFTSFYTALSVFFSSDGLNCVAVPVILSLHVEEKRGLDN